MDAVSIAMLGFAALATLGMVLAFKRGAKPKRRPPGFDSRVRHWKDDGEGE